MSSGIVYGRREVLAQLAGTAALTVFGAAAINQPVVAAVAKDLDLKSATPVTFRPVVGEYWKITGQSKPFMFESLQVFSDPNRSKRPRGIRQDSFSLLLSAPAGTSLAAGIYAVKSPSLGRFSVYMNEIRLSGTFSTSSVLGQAELFLSGVSANLQNDTEPKSYFEIPFN